MFHRRPTKVVKLVAVGHGRGQGSQERKRASRRLPLTPRGGLDRDPWLVVLINGADV